MALARAAGRPFWAGVRLPRRVQDRRACGGVLLARELLNKRRCDEYKVWKGQESRNGRPEKIMKPPKPSKSARCGVRF